MAVVVFVASDLVAFVAMPALAGLLIVVGVARGQAEPHLLGGEVRAAADVDHGA